MNPNASEFTMSGDAPAFVPMGMVPPSVAAARPKAKTATATAASSGGGGKTLDLGAAPAPKKAAAAAAGKTLDLSAPAPASASASASASAAAEPKKAAPAEPKKAAAAEPVKVDVDTAADPEFEVSDAALEAELAAIAAAEGKTVAELKATGDADVDDEDEDEGAAAVEEEEDFGDDERDPVNVVFIGHVDAGKSTLSGQILYQCGMVDERTIEKFQQVARENNRESWFLSYIMDTNEEERAKGKTVEVGRAYFNTETRRYTILDAPGHKNYVPNMIGGAAQADVAVLVISARKGEFETGFDRGGQTKEHAMLARTLGVGMVVVVVNKMDDPTVEWDEGRFRQIEGDLGKFLMSRGYKKDDIHFVPVSGLKGTNIFSGPDDLAKAGKEKSADLDTLYGWYKGEPLVRTLDNLRKLDRRADAPVRLPIIDRAKDRGTVQVMGKVETGTITMGDRLIIVPNNTPVEVVGIHTDQAKIRRAKPGENVRVSLKGVEEDGVQRGFMLCSPEPNVVPCVRKFEATLQILELLEHKRVFSAGYKAIFHVHTAVEECIVTHITARLNNKRQIVEKNPDVVKVGQMVKVIILLARPVPCELFADVPQLGRFSIRDEGKTICVGTVARLPGQPQSSSGAAAAGGKK